jgi:hypothetical protein
LLVYLYIVNSSSLEVTMRLLFPFFGKESGIP